MIIAERGIWSGYAQFRIYSTELTLGLYVFIYLFINNKLTIWVNGPSHWDLESNKTVL